jgi:CRISPR/Cas system CMR-associated protein Cmr1 (group 7 of RAMP superfamily)
MSRAATLLEYYNNPSKQVLTIEYANEGTRKALNTLLATIQRLGGWGCSRRIIHDVDGDGAYRVKKIQGLDDVEIPDTESDDVKVPRY